MNIVSDILKSEIGKNAVILRDVVGWSELPLETRKALNPLIERGVVVPLTRRTPGGKGFDLIIQRVQ